MGRNRTTFFAGNYVYKVPRSTHGICDNEHEQDISHKPNMANCWVWYDADEFPILVMERVDEDLVGDLPEWTHSIDCCQVGISRISGKLVAYDFGRF